jgi:hypothetical protein
MNALIYLRTETPVITGEDLERLDLMRPYALAAGYTVTEVWPVYAPFESPTDIKHWTNARQDLEEGRFDAIVFWHEGQGTPRPRHQTREDLGYDRGTSDSASPEGFQPGARVKYDDAAGEVLERVYSTARGAWDCQVQFDGVEGTGTVWESDLVPE